jgi:hypothetical protein
MDIPGVRLAFMAHGDYYDLKNDRYLIKWLDFGATLDEICDFFEYLPITHGGDADECYELVLRKVRDSLSWTTGGVYKIYNLYRSAPHYFLFFNIEEYLPSHSIFGFLLSNQCHLQILQTDILAHGDQNLLLFERTC